MASLIVSGSAVTISAGSGVYSPPNIYSPLTKLRSYMTLASADTSDDNELKRYLWQASRAIDNYCRRRFFPYQRPTQYYDLPRDRILRVKDDLLEVVGLSGVNGASEIDSSVYWARCGDTWNLTPYDRIELDESSGSMFNYSGTPQRAIHLDGIWGYHERYNNPDEAWVDSGATLTASMNATVTLASVTGSAGQNTIGVAPRITTEQLWKVDNEYIHVVDSESTSKIRIIRGVNGTTAASHASGVSVQTWFPEPDIRFATRRLAAWQYQQATAPFTHKVQTLGFGTLEFPETWPADVLDKIERFRQRRVY